MSYDRKCYDLAKAFLSDCYFVGDSEREEVAGKLAQEIQTTIEDFLEEKYTGVRK